MPVTIGWGFWRGPRFPWRDVLYATCGLERPFRRTHALMGAVASVSLNGPNLSRILRPSISLPLPFATLSPPLVSIRQDVLLRLPHLFAEESLQSIVRPDGCTESTNSPPSSVSSSMASNWLDGKRSELTGVGPPRMDSSLPPPSTCHDSDNVSCWQTTSKIVDVMLIM